MDSFYFEEKHTEYLSLCSKEKSICFLLFKLVDFLEELLTQENDLLKEVFVAESALDLLTLLELYSAFGIEFSKTNRLLNVIKKTLPHISNELNTEGFVKIFQRIEKEYENLGSVLNGNQIMDLLNGAISFPVIEKSPSTGSSYGRIEKIIISINQNRKTNKTEFNIIPSLPIVEEKLDQQIKTSWNYAINYVNKKYKKKDLKLEVTIKFINKLGIYEGDSLGVALTVGFIQELIRYYDLRDELSFGNNIISTGSMDDSGNILEVGKEIIKVKTITAFYSEANIFTVPLNDLQFAKSAS